MIAIKLAMLSILCLLGAVPALATDSPAPMRIPEHEASIQKNDQMPDVELGKLRTAFNALDGEVRVVSLLSPTCSVCQDGHNAVKKIFTDLKSDRLKGLLVWLPMKPKDDAHMALAQSINLKDRRIVLEGWDEDKDIAKLFSKTLGLKVAAWDVYLVYAPGVKWTNEAPPAPTFWMHQLKPEDGASAKQCLNLGKLKGEIKKLL